VSPSYERNDRNRTQKPAVAKHFRGRPGPPRSQPDKDGADWIWGWHTVCAALGNTSRAPAKRLLATPDRAQELTARFGPLHALSMMDGPAITALLPSGAVHQGLALKGLPPESLAIDEIGQLPGGVLVMLDQLTDPQNVGAIFRSAAAFGARGVILQDRNAPALSGALAKAAAGAIDAVPHARVTNLSRALEQLSEMGWRAVGLDGEAPEPLEDVLDGQPTVLVLGSEGDGLRRLVSEHCDALGSIPMPGGFESLNVSTAAAIALYEASRPRSMLA
jgi:23S rRNA (guanosine2251-2'-O)-methyltransferase